MYVHGHIKCFLTDTLVVRKCNMTWGVKLALPVPREKERERERTGNKETQHKSLTPGTVKTSSKKESERERERERERKGKKRKCTRFYCRADGPSVVKSQMVKYVYAISPDGRKERKIVSLKYPLQWNLLTCLFTLLDDWSVNC